MHSVCSSFKDLWIKSSRDVVRAAENSLFASPSTVAITASCFEIAPDHVTNWNVAKRTCQRLLCFLTNQTKVQILDWRQTTHAVNVSGVLFSRLTKAWLTAESGPSLVLLFFRAPLKKERLIAGYNFPYLSYKQKTTSIHVHQFIMSSLINLQSFIGSFLRIRCKRMEIWDPKHTNFYKGMYGRGQALTPGECMAGDKRLPRVNVWQGTSACPWWMYGRGQALAPGECMAGDKRLPLVNVWQGTSAYPWWMYGRGQALAPGECMAGDKRLPLVNVWQGTSACPWWMYGRGQALTPAIHSFVKIGKFRVPYFHAFAMYGFSRLTSLIY